MIIHLSFIRNVWISATLSATVTLPFTYPNILTLLTSKSLLSMMVASLTSFIQLSLTYPHIPDEAQMNNHEASYLVSIHLIFVINENAACFYFRLASIFYFLHLNCGFYLNLSSTEGSFYLRKYTSFRNTTMVK